MKRPAFQFYPYDWRNNANLRRCSWEARGVWIEIMSLMHDSDEYGVLTWPTSEIALAIGAQPKAIKELITKGVMKGCDNGQCEPFVFVPRSGRKDGKPVTLIEARPGPIWYSSRMVRDEYVRSVRGESSRFGSAESDSPNSAPKPPPKPPPKGGIGAAPNPSPDQSPDSTPLAVKSDGSTSSSSISSKKVGEDASSSAPARVDAPADPPAAPPPPPRRASGERSFRMSPSWRPSQHIGALAKQSGIRVENGAIDAAVGEFIGYWMTRAEALTQAEWDHKLLRSMRVSQSLNNDPAAKRPRNGGANGSWWASEAATNAKAAEFGMQARNGESWDQFRDRIRVEIARRDRDARPQ